MAVTATAAASVAVLLPLEVSLAAPSFSASAGADLVRVGFRIEPGVVVEQLLDPGAATAQAQLDSLGTSTAFASNPFPGTFAVSLPGTFAGAVGTPGFAYPLAVSSSWPAAPEATAGAGPLQLSAESKESGSAGTVTDGASRAASTVSRDPATGEVDARAETVVGEVNFSGLLTLAGIRSVATATRRPGGEVQRAAELSVSRLTVLDRSFRIGPDGISLTDQHLPGGDARAVLDPLLARLAELGVSLGFLDPVTTADGVISGALSVTWRTEIPDQGIATVTATFGRVFASASDRAAGQPAGAGLEFGDGGSTTTGADLTAGPAEPPPLEGPAPAEGPMANPAGPVLPAEPAGGAAAAAVAPAASPVPAGGGGLAGAPELAATVIDDADTTPVSRIYPVFVAVALGLLGVATVFRHRGVRQTWNS